MRCNRGPGQRWPAYCAQTITESDQQPAPRGWVVQPNDLCVPLPAPVDLSQRHYVAQVPAEGAREAVPILAGTTFRHSTGPGSTRL